MTSTGFTVGFGDAPRASSKVLKPPGGGSSDIFGTQSSQSQRTVHNADSTQSRLFGSAGDPNPAPVKPDRMRSDIFNEQPTSSPKSAAKKYVSRNPITGEVIEIASTNGSEAGDEIVSDNVTDGEATNNSDTVGEGTAASDLDKDNSEANAEKNCVDVATKGKDPVIGDGPARSVQTCIRIKNPPGGKSSGIF